MTSRIGAEPLRLVRNNLGFTLIEVILVTLLMVILASIALPDFHSTYSLVKLKTATDDLAYAMRYAQSRSIMKNHPVRLEFDAGHARYWLLEKVVKDDGTNLDEFQRLSGRMGRDAVIPEGVRVEGTENVLNFNFSGDIDKCRFYVCVDKNCRTISTQEQKGTVRVFEERVE